MSTKNYKTSIEWEDFGTLHLVFERKRKYNGKHRSNAVKNPKSFIRFMRDSVNREMIMEEYNKQEAITESLEMEKNPNYKSEKKHNGILQNKFSCAASIVWKNLSEEKQNYYQNLYLEAKNKNQKEEKEKETKEPISEEKETKETKETIPEYIIKETPIEDSNKKKIKKLKKKKNEHSE